MKKMRLKKNTKKSMLSFSTLSNCQLSKFTYHCARNDTQFSNYNHNLVPDT